MSKKISTLGKVWLIFLIILSSAGVVGNLVSIKDGIVYLVSALACAGELFGAIYLIQGKGINYLYVYSGCYIVNGILSLVTGSDQSISYIIGFILGIFINIGLTYLAAKNTFKD